MGSRLDVRADFGEKILDSRGSRERKSVQKDQGGVPEGLFSIFFIKTKNVRDLFHQFFSEFGRERLDNDTPILVGGYALHVIEIHAGSFC